MKQTIFHDFKIVFSFHNLFKLVLWSIVISPFVYHTILPRSIQLQLGFTFLDTMISPFLIPSLLLMGIMSFRAPAYPPLYIFGIFALIWSIVCTVIMSNHFPHALLVCITLFMPFIFLSTNPIGEFETSFLKISCFVLLLITGAQIALTSLGLYEYTSATGEVVGHLDEISRARTTIGAATGSSVMFFLLMVCGIYLSRHNNLQVLAFLGLGSVAVMLTFTRGSILMLGVFICFTLILKKIGNKPIHVGYKIAIFVLISSVTCYVFYSTPDIITLAIDRFEEAGVDSWSRTYRYMEAWEATKQYPIFGTGITGYQERNSLISIYATNSAGATSPHNVYLLFSAEGGLILGAALLILCAYLLVRTILQLNFFFMGCMLAIVVIGHNLEIIYAEPPWNFFWALFFALALQSIRNSSPPKHATNTLQRDLPPNQPQELLLPHTTR